MSDVALFAGDRFYRGQFNNGLTSYTIFQKDGIVYADPGFPGGIPYSGTDAATVINQSISALSAIGGTVVLKRGIYTINSTITLNSDSVILKGEGVSDTMRNIGTQL